MPSRSVFVVGWTLN